MRQNLHYGMVYRSSLQKRLDKLGVKYDILRGIDGKPNLITFDVDRDSEAGAILLKSIISRPYITNVYSKTEFEEADFLRIIPLKYDVDITNEEEALRFSCNKRSLSGLKKSRHEVQVSSFQVDKREINKRSTLHSSTRGPAYIFASSQFQDMVIKSNVTGIRFIPVTCQDSSSSQHADIFQLVAEQSFAFEQIAIDGSVKVKICPNCGKPKIIYPSTYELHLKGSPGNLNKDFYMTEAIFGYGVPEPFYFISHRLYMLMKEEKMTRSISFSPVRFQDK